jgi:hypothetical protein
MRNTGVLHGRLWRSQDFINENYTRAIRIVSTSKLHARRHGALVDAYCLPLNAPTEC